MSNYEKIRAEVAKKYKLQFNELKNENKTLRNKNSQLEEEARELKSKIREQDEWIDRLLEFTEIPKDYMQQIIQTKNTTTEITKLVDRFFDRLLQ